MYVVDNGWSMREYVRSLTGLRMSRPPRNYGVVAVVPVVLCFLVT